MGGRGSSGGGGKGRSGGGIGVSKTYGGIVIKSEPFTRGNYNIGETIKHKETDTRYTNTETKETISKSVDRVLDSKKVENSDGTTTHTDIIRGSKGNLYAVELTNTRKGTVIRTRIKKATKV